MEEGLEEEILDPIEPTEEEVDQILNSNDDEENDTFTDEALNFDSSGFINYILKQQGLIPENAPRITPSTIGFCGYFMEIPWKHKKRGDILCKNEEHMVLYEGDNMIIHASNRLPYPRGGVKEEELNFVGRAYRIKRYGVE